MEWNGEERRMSNEDRRQVCFMHKDTLEELKDHVKELSSIVAGHSNFVSQAKVIGVIASFIFASSFIYTYNHKQESDAILVLHRALIDANKETSVETRGDYKALLVEIRSLTREVGRSNEQNGRLIDALISISTGTKAKVEIEKETNL